MPKIKIAPSILSADLKNVNSEIKEVEMLSNLIHIDIMDGIFVPNTTIDSEFVKTIKTKIPLDVHLMVKEPSEQYIKEFIDAGAYSVTVHQEACKNLDKTLGFIKKNKAKCAVAINPGTPLIKIKTYLGIVDMVLIMTVEPGKAGQKFMPEPISKVRELRGIMPEMDIEVDGGINSDTAKLCVDAGANVFVSGSSIFGKKDRAGAIKDLISKIR